ncbi:MAG: hypothetical protein ACJA04_000179 [Cellvibrionaceae bacterium]|jgi:hypothetical protein
MSQKTVQTLISDLHDRFGDDLTSPQQQELMKKLKMHAHNLNENEPTDLDFKDTLTVLLEDIEVQHPQEAQVIREVIQTLSNMGI